MYAGIFHGDEGLCATESTRAILRQEVSTEALWNWNENIVFAINVCDLPRGARLCFAIYAVYGGKKQAKKKGREVRM